MTDEQMSQVQRWFTELRHEIRETNKRLDDGLRETNAKIDDGLRETNAKIDDGLRETNAKIDATNARIDDGLRETNAKIENLEGHIKLLAEAYDAARDKVAGLDPRFVAIEKRAEDLDLRVVRIESARNRSVRSKRTKPTRSPTR